MPHSTFSHAQIRGIRCTVPDETEGLRELERLFDPAEMEKVSRTVGVLVRRVAPPGLCTSDLCHRAADKLLNDLGWERDSVDGLIFVTQGADFPLPATACILQERLGLSKQCAAFDVNLGCSGYVYGLWLANALIESRACSRILLLVGDVSTRAAAKGDRSVAPLFGDAGAATAIEYCEESLPSTFSLHTDGKGYKHLIIPFGGARNPSCEASRIESEREDGNCRNDEHLFMDGAQVFVFTLREIPPLIKRLLRDANWTVENTDSFVMHQANRFILEHLAKRLSLPAEKVPIMLEQTGNTSSASVPLALCLAHGNRLQQERMNLLLAGFGVGFSWAACTLKAGPMVVAKAESMSGEQLVHHESAI